MQIETSPLHAKIWLAYDALPFMVHNSSEINAVLQLLWAIPLCDNVTYYILWNNWCVGWWQRNGWMHRWMDRCFFSRLCSTPENHEFWCCYQACVVCQLNPDILQLPVDSKQRILTRMALAFNSYSELYHAVFTSSKYAEVHTSLILRRSRYPASQLEDDSDITLIISKT